MRDGGRWFLGAGGFFLKKMKFFCLFPSQQWFGYVNIPVGIKEEELSSKYSIQPKQCCGNLNTISKIASSRGYAQYWIAKILGLGQKLIILSIGR